MKPYESIYLHYVTVKPFVLYASEKELETSEYGRDRGKFPATVAYWMRFCGSSAANHSGRRWYRNSATGDVGTDTAACICPVFVMGQGDSARAEPKKGLRTEDISHIDYSF